LPTAKLKLRLLSHKEAHTNLLRRETDSFKFPLTNYYS
jgi:hypothetical protein